MTIPLRASLLAALLAASCTSPPPLQPAPTVGAARGTATASESETGDEDDVGRVVHSGPWARPVELVFVGGLALSPAAELAGSVLLASDYGDEPAQDAEEPGLLLAWAILSREQTGARDVGRTICEGVSPRAFTTRAIGVMLLRGGDGYDAALAELLGEPAPVVAAERFRGDSEPARSDLTGLTAGGALAVDLLDALVNAAPTPDDASIEIHAVRVLLAEAQGDAAFRFLATHGRTVRARAAGFVGLAATSPRELDRVLAALRASALRPPDPQSKELDTRLTPAGRLAAHVLHDAGTFPGLSVGDDGGPSADAFAMKALLADPRGAEAFTDLAYNGNASGKMFAACGLYLRKRASLPELRRELLDAGPVPCQDGCCVDRRGAKQVLAQIESGEIPAMYEAPPK